MAENIASTPRKRRGPYKKSKYIEEIKEPRSTAWFKKKKQSHCFAPTSLEHPDPSTDADSYQEAQASTESQSDEELVHSESSTSCDKDGDVHTQYADDEEDPDSEEEFENNSGDLPHAPEGESLYQGSRLSLLESIVLIITFVLRHQLTREATKDLLSLLELHCLTPNLCRSSMHLFYNFFTELTSPVQKHFFVTFVRSTQVQ
ncbi:uncharacterized protein LOC123555350 [Mercenaria mercenaria]|uniref:uncharacterized protein LOC123555350 n=1 Tax=Mercenaria mercenaria TaxID=6596 RepID=UPI00234F6623|nr:uncharacterized protein LOC123555350 [Mercenaria mercenaria]